MNMLLQKYVYVLQKIYWFSYLQLLWMLFTLLGLVVFGAFPAAYALSKVIKQEGEITAKETFQLFAAEYKGSFIKLNLAAVIWGGMFLLISTNLVIFHAAYMTYLIMGMLGLVLLGMCHFLQYFEQQTPIIQQVKRAFSLLFLLPKKNAGYMLIFILFAAAVAMIPGIVFFFGVSVPIYFAVKIGGTSGNDLLISIEGSN